MRANRDKGVKAKKRKREREREINEGEKKREEDEEKVGVCQPPYPIDRHVLNPFPPVDSLLAVRLSSAKIQR